jgi:hypothetical protein
MLREMGIQVWIPRESEEQTVVAVQEVNVEENRVVSQVSSSEVVQSVSVALEDSIEDAQENAQENAPTSLEMKWTLLFDRNDANQEKLRSQVLRVIVLGVMSDP